MNRNVHKPYVYSWINSQSELTYITSTQIKQIEMTSTRMVPINSVHHAPSPTKLNTILTSTSKNSFAGGWSPSKVDLGVQGSLGCGEEREMGKGEA